MQAVLVIYPSLGHREFWGPFTSESAAAVWFHDHDWPEGTTFTVKELHGTVVG